VLVNPANAVNTQPTLRDVQSAAGAMGLQIPSTSREINAAFGSLGRERPDVLFVDNDAYFYTRRVQLVHLATRHAIPATYSLRDFVEAGGLMSCGTKPTLRMPIVRSASMPVASSRARSLRSYQSCN
jgi:putative ABC transport system substrate-binding protein